MQSAPHQLSFAPRPLLQLAAALALGILAAKLISLPFVAPLVCGGFAFVAASFAFLKNCVAPATILVTITFFAAGASLQSLENRTVSDERIKQLLEQKVITVGDPVEITGVLRRAPEVTPQGLYLELEVETLSLRNSESVAPGTVMLFAPIPEPERQLEYDGLELRYGARLRVMTALDRAEKFRNPGVSSFVDYLDQKGFDATGVIKSPLLIERLEDESVFLPLAWLYKWRRILEQQMHAILSRQTAGVLDAALLGNRHFLSRPVAERFREGGTFHVLVISGLHISFIGGVMFLLARRITDNRALQFALSATVLWGYALVVGAESSVVRAALMFTTVTFAPVVARRRDSLNALGGAAIVLLIVQPGDLFNPSFQLTFLSVLAISAFAWPLLSGMAEIGNWRPTSITPSPPRCASWLRNLSELLFWSERQWQREMAEYNYSYRLFKAPLATILERYRLQRFIRYAFGAIVVSASVQLFLLPLLVIYFHRVSFASLLLNIWVGAGITVLAALALVALIVEQLSAAFATPIIALANIVGHLTIHSVDLFGAIGMSSLRVPEYSGFASMIYFFYFLLLALLTHVLSRWRPFLTKSHGSRWRRVGLVQGIAASIILLHPFSSAGTNDELRVDFLDVGQGDSILVSMPDGTTLLVDGGGRPDFLMGLEADEAKIFRPDRRGIGEAVVSEFLWHRGLDTVDYILATHAHADHIDGLSDVARNFRVRAALVGRSPQGDPEYLSFSEALREKQIPLIMVEAGDVLHFGRAKANVLWPPSPAHSDSLSPNDDSVVLRIDLGEHSVLLTGDIESRAEKALIKGSPFRSDVVKVPHHGSRSSSTPDFIKAAGAHYAIISVGQRSIFGHPDHGVVERWRATGAEVLTTGSSGAITFTTDGREAKLSTFVRD
ncbi:MAG TPA: ComEC/Rec2 family competence protein [Pyrinomonadaceae bacterium]|nr:ComEC/Rec2 family competence protein [Pyrinomonadaceae bacterium]